MYQSIPSNPGLELNALALHVGWQLHSAKSVGLAANREHEGWSRSRWLVPALLPLLSLPCVVRDLLQVELGMIHGAGGSVHTLRS